MSKAFENMEAGSPQPEAQGRTRAAAPRSVACPACGARVEWVAANRYRPFCSARCKGVDLGAWASEKYRVAAVEEAKPDEPSA